MENEMTPVLPSADAADLSSKLPEALRPPTKPVGLGLPLGLTFSTMSWLMVGLPILSILLPEQVNQLDPVNKVTTLGLILTLGGLAGVISPPLSGALSDRTTSRLGRRRPWILGGALGVTLGLLFASQANSILLVAALWIVINCAGNALLTVLSVVMPDRIPEKQRGTASAITGLAFPVGNVLGLLLTTTVLNMTGQSIPLTYVALILVIVVLAGGFFLIYREPRLPKGTLPPFRFWPFVAGFWVNPIKHPNFFFAWITRFLVFLGFFSVSSFSNYYLRDVIHYTDLFPGHSVAEGVTLLTIISTVGTAVSTLLAGILSDRVGRRKPFVIGSSILIGISLIILSLVHSWPAVLISFALQGLGFGAYSAVDMAMNTQVLPDAENKGKDMGVLTISLNIAQFLAPSVGAIVISIFAAEVITGYAALYAVAAVLTFLGAFLVMPIRGIK